ncbi:MAG TPA: hypothetical protein VN445_11230 [Rectinemataceae bacterium]|nr:hypothetical protein [Rectinemataceae bacterium]
MKRGSRLERALRHILALGGFLAMLAGGGLTCAAQDASATSQTRGAGIFAAGLWADAAPLLELTNQAAEIDGYTPDSDDLARYFARPSVLSGGFSLAAGPFRAAMVLEFQQDFGEMLKGGALTNFLLSRDGSSFMFSNNYPNVGFIEGSGGWWRLSLGRRAINIGRGLASLSVSGENPRYDHLTAGLSAPLGGGSLGYDFLAISVPRTSTVDGKSLFFHRVGLDFSRFSLGFAEYNLVTGVALDFQDIGPFLVYHHLFADGSNVMLHLDGEWRPVSFLRFYGEALMDDFQLSGESSGSNPNAFGFSAGLQWKIADGVRMERPRYFREDYRLEMVGKSLDGGLVATLDAYWASTYLYRRSDTAPNQAYSTLYFMQSDSLWAEVPSWFAYPLGPDRILIRGDLKYSLAGLSVSGKGTLAILGDQSGESTYTLGSTSGDWLGPQAPVTLGWDASLRAEIVLGKRSLGTASAAFSKMGTDSPIFSMTFGYVHRFGYGLTP